MGKILIFLCLFCIAFSTPLFCEEIEIDSNILSINPEHEYFIIKAGEKDKVELGDGLIVHRLGEKIAEAKIIEVRPDVSAAEILNVAQGKEIKEGDDILIVKQIKEPKKSLKKIEAAKIAPRKSKWATVLGPGEKKAEAPKKSSWATILGSKQKLESIFGGQKPFIVEEGANISLEIQNNERSVFSYTIQVLKEEGYSIIFSNRLTGVISATKPIALSLISELWADSIAAIDHKVVATFNIKNNGDASKLSISSFKEHYQKKRQIKIPIKNNSKCYNELLSIASKIKERSEE